MILLDKRQNTSLETLCELFWYLGGQSSERRLEKGRLFEAGSILTGCINLAAASDIDASCRQRLLGMSTSQQAKPLYMFAITFSPLAENAIRPAFSFVVAMTQRL